MPIDVNATATILIVLAAFGALAAYVIRVSTAETEAADKATAHLNAPTNEACEADATNGNSSGPKTADKITK